MGVARLIKPLCPLVLIFVFSTVNTATAQFDLSSIPYYSKFAAGQNITGKVYAGYFRNEVGFGGSLKNPVEGNSGLIFPVIDPVFQYRASDVTYDHSGLSLGLKTEYSPDIVILDMLGRMNFSLSGWMNFTHKSSDALQDWDRSTSPTLTAAGLSLPSISQWDVDPTWWWVEGLTYFEILPKFEIISGLRYEYYSVNFDNPRSDAVTRQNLFIFIPVDILAPYHSPRDEATTQIAGIMPVIGFRFKQKGPMSELALSLSGWPYTIEGKVKFEETIGDLPVRIVADGVSTNGYRLSALLDYNVKIPGIGTAGGFLRWDGAHMLIDNDMDEVNFTITDPGNPFVPTIVGSGAGGDGDASSVQNAITIGGSFSMDFQLP